MRYNKLFVGLFLIQVLFFFCEKEENNTVSQKFNSEYEQFPSNLNESVNCVHFIDDKTGFAASVGQIYRTTDSGFSWDIDSITDLPFNSIFFANNDIGFAVGGKSGCSGGDCSPPGSIVYKTLNSGQSWIKQLVPYEWSELNSVFFINESIGFAIGLGLHIKTKDGGETWEQFEFEYKGLMRKINFIDSQTGFAAGLFGNIFKTTNQGENWSQTNNESDGHIYDFYFVNDNVGYAGGQKEIVKTVDGGDTWNILTNSPTEIYFIHFADENNGIAVGKGHYTGGDWGIWTKALYRTSNGGQTWEMEDDIDFNSKVSFYSSFEGYSIVPNKIFKISFK